MNTPSKVVVFGAKGFLGEHIAQGLVNQKHEVYALVGSKPEQASQIDDVTYLEGDLEDCNSIQRAVAGMDAVIFSLGWDWQPRLVLTKYQRRLVRITENFFRALGNRPDRRIVYTSSITTIAGSKTPIVFSEDCDWGLLAQSQFRSAHRAWLQCEKIALDYATQGNNLVVLNPGYLVGPGVFHQSNMETSVLLLRMVQNQFPFYVDGGQSFCDVREVADAHVAALTQGESGERYLLGGHNLRIGDLANQILPMLGFNKPPKLPVYWAYALSILLKGLTSLTGDRFQPFYRPRSIYPFAHFYYGDSSKAIQQLGYQIRPFEMTILDTIKSFYERGLLPTELSVFKEITSDNASALLCLRQLAQLHPFSQFLLPRIPEIYAVCCSNYDLNSTLDRLLCDRQFNFQLTQSNLLSSPHKRDLKTLHNLFDYLYFASNDFLAGVM